MRKKAKVIKNIIFKAAGFFLAGVLVSMALLNDSSTLAWFSSRVTSGLQVQAASADDIIQDFYTLSGGEKSSQNPDTIVVKKAPNMNRNLIIYFSLDDKNSGKNSARGLSGYMLHINPIEMKDNGQNEFRAQIEMKFNWRDLVYLWDNFNKSTSGTLTLRYLNGFVVREYPVTFDNGYLWCQAVASLTGIADLKYSKKHKDDLETQMNPYIAQIIANIAQSVRWNEIISSARTVSFNAIIQSENTVTEQTYAAGKTNPFAASTMARARMNGVTNPFERIQLTKEQQSIIDIVAPGLAAYIDDIYNFAEDLIARFNEKLEEIDRLNLAIDGMNAQIQGLNAAIDDLTQKYTALEQEKAALMEEKLNLEQENMKLRDKIDDLEDEIDSLVEKNSGLKDEMKNLESTNSSLAQENQRLKDENDSLRKEIESLKNSAPSGSGSGNSAPGGSTQPSDGSEPPTGTPPPAVEPPDGGSKDSGTEQPPVQEPGEQPPAGQEPGAEEPPAEESGAEEPGPPSSGEQPPAGDSLEEDPAAEDFIEKPPAETPSPYVETPENGDPSFDEQPATESPAEEETPAGEPDPQEGSPQAEDVLIAP